MSITTPTPTGATPTPAPATLSDYYGGNVINPNQTAADRFALPGFADAAKTAGYDLNSYHVNMGNADANTAILNALNVAKAGGNGAGGTPVVSTDPTTKTVGAAYVLPGTQTNPDEDAARAAQKTFLDNEANGTSNVDEGTIRANTLKEFQAEIDATNQLYAQKLQEAQLAGQGRLGSNTAVQARRGLLGSDFGNAETDTVNKGNTDINNGIEAQKEAAVQAILTKSNDTATKAIADKTAAMSSGLDARLKYYQDADTRKTTNATNAATFIYQQGLSPNDLTPDQLKQTATNYGIAPEDITKAFVGVKTTGDAAKAVASKKNFTSVPAGGTIVDENGKVIATGENKPVSVGSKSTLYQKNADGTYKAVASGSDTNGSGSTGPTSGNLAQIGQTLKNYIGADTYADPYQYLNAYNHWVTTLGGSAAQFLSKYPPKDYVNPKASTLTNADGTPLLPPNLLPKKAGRAL